MLEQVSLVPVPVSGPDLQPARTLATALADAFLISYEGATRAAYGRDLVPGSLGARTTESTP